MQHRVQHIGHNTSDTIHRVQHIGVTSGTTHRTQHRAQHIGRNTSVATHLYIYVLFHQRIPIPDLRTCAVEGRCPYLDILPLQGAILFKPCSWGGGTQGVAVLRPALPWAEIPLPLQGAASSKPSKHCIKLAVKKGATRVLNFRNRAYYMRFKSALRLHPLSNDCYKTKSRPAQ